MTEQNFNIGDLFGTYAVVGPSNELIGIFNCATDAATVAQKLAIQNPGTEYRMSLLKTLWYFCRKGGQDS